MITVPLLPALEITLLEPLDRHDDAEAETEADDSTFAACFLELLRFWQSEMDKFFDRRFRTTCTFVTTQISSKTG